MKIAPLLKPRNIRNFFRSVARYLWAIRCNQPIMVPRDISEVRKAICMRCPRREGLQCLECGCSIPAKVMFTEEFCPIDHWN